MPYRKHSSFPRSPRCRCRCSRECCPRTRRCAGRGLMSISCHLKKTPRERDRSPTTTQIAQPPSPRTSRSEKRCEKAVRKEMGYISPNCSLGVILAQVSAYRGALAAPGREAGRCPGAEPTSGGRMHCFREKH